MITSKALAPFEFTIPVKEASKTEIYGEEEFEYKISHFIPGEDEDFYYSKYILEDNLEKCLEVCEKINITDDSNKDRSNWFIVSNNENVIKIQAKESTLKNEEFYNNNFYFKIPVKKKKECNMQYYYNKAECIVENKVGYCVERNKKESKIKGEPVYVKFYAKIDTEVVNGTIDKSISKIPLGSNKEISYMPNDGYKLKQILVDGKDININENKNNYNFININQNHSIKVIYEIIGQIKLKKEGENHELLSGVNFELHNENRELIDKKTTNQNGEIIFDNLDLGKYCLIETKTQNGYELLKEPIKCEIKEENSKLEFTVKNSHKFELPFAGGNNRIIYTMLGFILIGISALIVLKIDMKRNIEKYKSDKVEK